MAKDIERIETNQNNIKLPQYKNNMANNNTREINHEISTEISRNQRKNEKSKQQNKSVCIDEHDYSGGEHK